MIRPIKIIHQRDYQEAIRSFLAREEVQAYSMAILSFFALAFFSVFAIRPTLISFFNLRRQIQDSRETEKQLDSKINSLLKAQDEYQKNQADIEILSQVLPADPQFPELLRKIETLVDENEATITAFSTQKFTLLEGKKGINQAKNEISTVNFSAAIAPDYGKNESVISRLMNLRRMITLTFLSFTNNESEKEERIESTIDAEAYYQLTEGGTSEQ